MMGYVGKNTHSQNGKQNAVDIPVSHCGWKKCMAIIEWHHLMDATLVTWNVVFACVLSIRVT